MDLDRARCLPSIKVSFKFGFKLCYWFYLLPVGLTYLVAPVRFRSPTQILKLNLRPGTWEEELLQKGVHP